MIELFTFRLLRAWSSQRSCSKVCKQYEIANWDHSEYRKVSKTSRERRTIKECLHYISYYYKNPFSIEN